MPDTSRLDLNVVANTLLPSKSDDMALRKNMAVILVQHLEYFKFAFEDIVEWHIDHCFHGEMSEKSVVVHR